jgi:hypothetical protein
MAARGKRMGSAEYCRWIRGHGGRGEGCQLKRQRGRGSTSRSEFQRRWGKNCRGEIKVAEMERRVALGKRSASGGGWQRREKRVANEREWWGRERRERRRLKGEDGERRLVMGRGEKWCQREEGVRGRVRMRDGEKGCWKISRWEHRKIPLREKGGRDGLNGTG